MYVAGLLNMYVFSLSLFLFFCFVHSAVTVHLRNNFGECSNQMRDNANAKVSDKATHSAVNVKPDLDSAERCNVVRTRTDNLCRREKHPCLAGKALSLV